MIEALEWQQIWLYMNVLECKFQNVCDTTQ